MESTAALSSKVAAIEDEMRIIKGEVKQVLTEIRSAILVQDNPFEEATNRPRAVQIVPAVAEEPARVEIVMPHSEPQPAVIATAVPHPDDEVTHQQPTATPQAQNHTGHEVAAPHVTNQTSQQPQAPRHQVMQGRWSLLTVASLAAWAEEALEKLGSKRLAMLLDLCEVSGYLTPDARQALARVSELDAPEPEQRASAMDVTVLLRQLDALLQGEPSDLGPRLMY